ERRDRDEEQRRQHAAGDLERDRALEQPSEPSPVLARRVTEAELDERLLDGQVEQALDERRHGENEGVKAERLGGEDVERDDRRAEAEYGGSVGPGGRGRAAPEEPRAHAGSLDSRGGGPGSPLEAQPWRLAPR